MWYQDWLIILSCFLRDINWIIVHCRRWTTCWSMSFEKQFSTACFVESVHFFFGDFGDFGDFAYWENIENGGANVSKCPILSSLLLNLWNFITAEPLRFLTNLSVYCWTFELYLLLNLWDSLLPYLFTAEPLNFVYCWTFEILICLLLNLWTLFTAEPLRFLTYLFTAEPLNFVYRWTFEILYLSVYCWTFEKDILNIWENMFKMILYFD